MLDIVSFRNFGVYKFVPHDQYEFQHKVIWHMRFRVLLYCQDIRWYSQAEYLDWDGSLVSGDPETSSFIGLLQRPELYGSVITYGENDPTRTVYDRELDVWQTDL